MNKIKQLYGVLHKSFGSQNWWPTTTKNRETEIVIGAILTQNTSWKNVEKAILNLKQNGLVDLRKLAAVETSKLARIIRPSGYYNQKARKLKAFGKHVVDNYMGDLRKLFAKDTGDLRSELLSIHGIGPETADSILLYAAGKPAFVVDAYTKRIFTRTGIIREDSSYDELQNLFKTNLPENTGMFSQYHALIVQLGKDVCRKKPLCNNCPLNDGCRHYKNMFL